MALKTVVKQGLSKWGPLSTEMQKAIEVDQAVMGPDGKPEYIDSTIVDHVEKPAASIPGPTEAPPVTITIHTIKGTFLTKKAGHVIAFGEYRISEDVAKLAKANFKDGDTAVVTWEKRDGAKFCVDLDRKAAPEPVEASQGEF